MEEIKKLIDFYLTTEVVINIELALNKLISLTTKENYLDIVNYIDTHKNNPSELDLSMYIFGIASKDYKELIPIINNKLKTFKDKDAIEDLEDALTKINEV